MMLMTSLSFLIALGLLVACNIGARVALSSSRFADLPALPREG